MKIIGIDPGTTATGYSIIEDGKGICFGTIRSKKHDIASKIFEICENLKQLIDKNKPDIAALEKVFYQKNIQSLLRSSELRGAIILTLVTNKMKILEYTPAQIKLTATGNGRASKSQVRYFIERILIKPPQADRTNTSNHAIDALAIAYTAYRKTRL